MWALCCSIYLKWVIKSWFCSCEYLSEFLFYGKGNWFCWFANRNCFLCLYSVANSFLLFKLAMWGWNILKYFSFKQKLHLPVSGEQDLALAMNFHCMLHSIPFYFMVQMYWLSVVAFFLFMFLKLEMCAVNLDLKVLLVKPVLRPTQRYI